MTRLTFTKGHGTENDFVLVPDLDGGRDVTPDEVRFLADRRAGIGGDGVIRVVRTAASAEPAVAAQAGEATWFMDYRNADGSVAEMCGNGTRVTAAYLVREGLEQGPQFALATRGGVKTVLVRPDGFAIGMGPWRLVAPDLVAQRGYDALVHFPGMEPLPAVSLDLGNPHTVVALPEEVDLGGVDLSVAPLVDPPPAHGTNVEIVRIVEDGHLRMRVHERGVGETRSCGTGACAAALAAMIWSGRPEEHRGWRVDVLGGTLHVRALPGDEVELAGPGVLVADGEVELPVLPA